MADTATTVRIETLIEKDGITTVDGRTYRLPDGWDVEQVRDLLRGNGFERIDNRQDSFDDPHPFE